MQLTQTIIINKQNQFYKECEKLTFLSKNLYNSALYYIRQYYFQKKQYANFYNVNNDFYLIDVPGYGYASVDKKTQKVAQNTRF